MTQNMINLLIIDDNWNAEYYAQLLSNSPQYSFNQQHIGLSDEIEDYLIPELDAILVAYHKPTKKLLRQLLAIKLFSENRDVQLPVLLLTEKESQQMSIDVIKSGISDYLDKETLTPVGLQEALLNSINKFQVIETLEQEQSQLVLMAYHDSLTKLPNRYAFEQTAKRMISAAKRHQRTLALMILDLDNFKQINDTMGHDVGDLLLIETAKRIQNIIREEDLFARLGGDEFAIILETDNKPQSAAIVASKIVEAMTEEFMFNSYSVHSKLSIGIANYPTAAKEITDLLKYADLALYEVKNNGGNNFQFFTDALNEEYIKRQQISLALREAIDNDEFHLVFQPVVELDGHWLIGAEALLRWDSASLGTISPSTFIPIAEDSGLIPAIGEWVLNAACQHYKNWEEHHGLPKNFKLSINISSLQLERSEFLGHVNHVISQHRVSPNAIVFELNETATMIYTQNVSDILNKISALGIGLIIDNFGTGQSCLDSLTKLNIDKLKIDLSFIKDLEKNHHHQRVVRAITSLGNAMDVAVLAEGIETSEQLQLLQEIGCQYGQGYFISKPVASEQFVLLLQENAKAIADQIIV